MASGPEQRSFPRHELPVLIEAPELANDWLRPNDGSMGGFMVNVPDALTVGTVCECAIRIEEKVFACDVSVVWVKEDLSHDPATWNADLWFKMPEDKQDEFETAIHNIREGMKE